MKLILLLLILISSSHCTKMNQIYRNSKTSLSTITSDNKYFYLRNSNYFSYDSNYIYILLEDNNFSLNYDNIKYCYTNTDPYYNPDSVVSSCYFNYVYYYSRKGTYGAYKFYYKIYYSPNAYTIVNYDGSYSSGFLYVTCDYNDLAETLKITHAYRNYRTPLPITSSLDKYFYVENSDYYPYSNYLYFYLEDNGFGLRFNNIKYCRTDTNPQNNPDSAIKSCSFNSISYYDPVYLSSSKIYHYKFPISSSYSYSIVYYEGSYSSGYLYAYCSYESTSEEDVVLTSGAIVGIVIGSIAFLVICIIIMICCCPCCRRNKSDLISVTQPNYFAPINSAFPSNQSNAVLPVNNPNIPLQTVPMPNEAN